jgi:hypothetical protein
MIGTVLEEHLSRSSSATGDRVLMTGAGADLARWATAARGLGLDVVCIEVDAAGAGLGGLTHLLWWDPSVCAVLVVPLTPASINVDVGAARQAIDLTGSDALLVVADLVGGTVRQESTP